MRKLSLAFALLATACMAEKDDAKGVVDDSLPPSIPADLGKADAADNTVALSVDSPHPYANNVDRAFHVDLASRLPACASGARVHFSVLRTEAGYDYVDLEVGGRVVQSFDGTHDDTWSTWFDVVASGLDVRLSTDESVTRHGFTIDRVEWTGGGDRCAPLVPCATGEIGVVAPTADCACPDQPACYPIGDVQIDHVSRRGFMHTGHQTLGTQASNIGTGPTDGTVTTPIGTVDPVALEHVLTLAQANGALFGPAYERWPSAGEITETLTIRTGGLVISYAAAQGSHDPAVASVIAAFEALFTCGNAGDAITCGDGNACIDNQCQPDDWCACEEIYQPVCGVNLRTYGNACAAGCADVAIAHDGECGAVGDQCGGLLGSTCTDANKCRYDVSTWSAPYPDAAGACVARTYCDAPSDCNGLPAPAVLGSWACDANACAFRAGPNWRDVTGGRFTTAHPYANGTSVWKELTLPAEAQALRLIASGTFRLERNYDFLEVWAWQNGAWTRVRRYTGTTAPATTDSFTGRYFYLRFVSDSSVTDHGFDITPQWR